MVAKKARLNVPGYPAIDVEYVLGNNHPPLRLPMPMGLERAQPSRDYDCELRADRPLPGLGKLSVETEQGGYFSIYVTGAGQDGPTYWCSGVATM